MNVGNLIKQARIAKALTQEELAEKIGVQKSAVAKWENGRVSEIKRSNLKRLSEALDLEPHQLLGEQKEKPTVNDDELSEDMQKLISRLKKLPEDKIRMLLDLAESIQPQDH